MELGGFLNCGFCKLPALKNGRQDQDMETYKYFLKWDDSKGKDLILDKMVVMRPFRTGDGVKRQSWMSSLIFDEKPRLVPISSP